MWAHDEISHTALTLAKNANCNEDRLDIAAIATSAIYRTQAGDESARRLLITRGAGGTGETHVINKVVRPLVRKMFGPAGERALAVPNGVSKILGDGATAIRAGFLARFQQQ